MTTRIAVSETFSCKGTGDPLFGGESWRLLQVGQLGCPNPSANLVGVLQADGSARFGLDACAFFASQRRLRRLNKGLYQFAKYSGIGLSWVLTTAAYLYLGYTAGNWVDVRLRTTPAFLLVGTILAMLLSLWTLVAEVRALTSDDTTSEN
jgi:hypothetical protein